MTFRTIGETLNMSRQGAQKAVYRALEEVAVQTHDAADRLRALEGQRLDAILRAAWPKKGEVEHAKLILAISARRARLMGLDAPQRTELTGAGGAPLNPPPPEPEIDLDKLTVEQLNQLQELLRLAGVEAQRASEVGLPEPARPALPPRAALLQVEVPRAVPGEPLRALPKPAVEDVAE